MPQAFNEDAPLALDTYVASARCMALRLGPYQAIQKRISRIRMSVVMKNQGIATTSILILTNGRNVVVDVRVSGQNIGDGCENRRLP